ncbi:MAG: hypothetical protein PVI78_04445 [Anaerolineales bacterium]|jgi:hypothetical protein
MAENTKPRRLILIILLVILALIVLTALLWYLQTLRLKAARDRFNPPQVYLVNPVQGQQEIAGTHMLVAASAVGFNPLISMELWVDGYHHETFEVGDAEGSEVIYGNFNVPVFEGVHMLVVRAIDIDGLVGSSLPVGYEGVKQPDPGFYVLNQPYNPIIPLEDLAESLGGDPGMAVDFNPGAASGEYPPGAPVEIPIFPGPEPDVPQVPADQLTQNGLATGKLCYPSEYIPAMTAYFKEVNTGVVSSLPIAENQLTYQISLPPGTYHAYAWLLDNSLGGSYSYAVPCGLDVSCTNHNLLPFSVFVGTTTTGIDICDWYSQQDVPQAPGAAAPTTPASPGGVEILQVDTLLPAGNQFNLPFVVAIPISAPPAPTDFSASVENCQVNLSWKSSGSMAVGYTVWMSDQTGLHRLLATLKPGSGNQLGYSFQPPKAGTLTVWVEAYNAIGSQSSNPAQVRVDTDCASEGSTDVRIESQVISVPPEYQQVYVYLSIDGYPEQRFPSDDSSFLIAEGGQVFMPPEAGESSTFVIPQLSDDSIELTADCWGWAGGQLSQISTFSDVLISSEWDAGTLNIGNERCGLSVIVNTSGDEYEYGTFTNGNPSIPAPFNVRETRLGSNTWTVDGLEEYQWFWERLIQWQWKGDISKITGFTIRLNGKPFATAPANMRSHVVTLPEWCGTGNTWTVTANAKSGSSPTSAPANGFLPNCPAYFVLGFEWLKLYVADDSFHPFSPAGCDTMEAYWRLAGGPVVNSFPSGGSYSPLSCGHHNIEQINQRPNSNLFVIPLSSNKATYFRAAAYFYDYDSGSSDDLFYYFDMNVLIPSFTNANQAIASSCVSPNPNGTVAILYPNSPILSSHSKLTNNGCVLRSYLDSTDDGKGRMYLWWSIYEPSSSGN